MARNRKKVYKQGDRINIYLSRDITPDFIEWINKQSDLSNFFLYAAQQLYQKTGFVDVSEVMPRKINFNLSSNTTREPIHQTEPEAKPIQAVEETIKKEDIPNDNENEEDKNNEAWDGLDDDFDDLFA